MYRLPLFDHRVIDLTDGPAALAGRILGDMVAEVIKVEPRSGDSLRGSDVFAVLNVNKYSFKLDVAQHPDILMRLAATADILLAPAGSVDAETVQEDNNGLVIVLLPKNAGPAACTAAAGAVGLALWDRRRTGHGGLIEVAALEAGTEASDAEPPATETVSALDGVSEVPSSPLILSETPVHIRLPAPAAGEHNEYVFRHLLGLSEAEAASLT